jgi:hypothetical protein
LRGGDGVTFMACDHPLLLNLPEGLPNLPHVKFARLRHCPLRTREGVSSSPGPLPPVLAGSKRTKQQPLTILSVVCDPTLQANGTQVTVPRLFRHYATGTTYSSGGGGHSKGNLNEKVGWLPHAPSQVGQWIQIDLGSDVKVDGQ